MFDVFLVNALATTEIYTLSLHDALPICRVRSAEDRRRHLVGDRRERVADDLLRDRVDARRRAHARSRISVSVAASRRTDRKSTRLNSSHANISYAVFCLKKKKHEKKRTI